MECSVSGRYLLIEFPRHAVVLRHSRTSVSSGLPLFPSSEWHFPHSQDAESEPSQATAPPCTLYSKSNEDRTFSIGRPTSFSFITNNGPEENSTRLRQRKCPFASRYALFSVSRLRATAGGAPGDNLQGHLRFPTFPASILRSLFRYPLSIVQLSPLWIEFILQVGSTTSANLGGSVGASLTGRYFRTTVVSHKSRRRVSKHNGGQIGVAGDGDWPSSRTRSHPKKDTPSLTRPIFVVGQLLDRHCSGADHGTPRKPLAHAFRTAVSMTGIPQFNSQFISVTKNSSNASKCYFRRKHDVGIGRNSSIFIHNAGLSNDLLSDIYGQPGFPPWLPLNLTAVAIRRCFFGLPFWGTIRGVEGFNLIGNRGRAHIPSILTQVCGSEHCRGPSVQTRIQHQLPFPFEPVHTWEGNTMVVKFRWKIAAPRDSKSQCVQSNVVLPSKPNKDTSQKGYAAPRSPSLNRAILNPLIFSSFSIGRE
ncbi:hypothetical protein DFH07DRAFT_772268 [Mycena maculata]|uniref:Uncharacterized protein n=1 Tax=Mycena maculata TaxID=230809 RepID=A0AAD7JCI1_9AGAR|nr:hypothetical protein DFH07DRAFT_772268 [Mycena maculata]